jgi:hypothetical protein
VFYSRVGVRTVLESAKLLRAVRASAANSPTTERIVESFRAYMAYSGHSVSRAQFEENLAGKLADKNFAADAGPLLAERFDRTVEEMAATVSEGLISRPPGDPCQIPVRR